MYVDVDGFFDLLRNQDDIHGMPPIGPYGPGLMMPVGYQETVAWFVVYGVHGMGPPLVLVAPGLLPMVATLPPLPINLVPMDVVEGIKANQSMELAMEEEANQVADLMVEPEEEEDPEEDPEEESEEEDPEDEQPNEPIGWEALGNLGPMGVVEEFFNMNVPLHDENGQIAEPELGIVGHVDHEQEDWNIVDEIYWQLVRDGAANLPAHDPNDEVIDP